MKTVVLTLGLLACSLYTGSALAGYSCVEYKDHHGKTLGYDLKHNGLRIEIFSVREYGSVVAARYACLEALAIEAAQE